MSRRTRRRRAERDLFTIASVPLFRPLVRAPVLSRFTDLRPIEDRRTFYPARFSEPARSLPRSAARLVVRPKVSSRTQPRLMVPSAVTFAAPKRVVLCVRRKRRREVLFARGKGGGGHRRPRRNQFSDVEC